MNSYSIYRQCAVKQFCYLNTGSLNGVLITKPTEDMFPYIKVTLVDYCFVKSKKRKKNTLKLILFLRKDFFDRHKDYIISYCMYN